MTNKTEALMVLGGTGTKLTKDQSMWMASPNAQNEDSFDFIPSVIKVALGGAKNFVHGEGVSIPSPLRAHVFDSILTRGYYPVKMDDGGRPVPFCSSLGSVFGTVNEGWDDEEFGAAQQAHMPHPAVIALEAGQDIAADYDCSRCPLSEFNSAHQGGVVGSGQGCKQKVRLLILPEGWTQPAILVLPTMSVKPWNAYCSEIQSETGMPFYAFQVEFHIDITQNAGGIKYGKVTPKRGDAVTGTDTINAVMSLQEGYRGQIRSRKVEMDDIDIVEVLPA